MKSLKQSRKHRIRHSVRRARPLLGTYVQIGISVRADPIVINTWITAGFEAMAEIDRLMSPYRPESDLSRLNRAQPRMWVEVHPHTRKVLQACNELYIASRGIFDIRCATPHPHPLPLKRRGKGGRNGQPRVRGFIAICGTRVRKSGPWTFDLGGIAKGYAVDCAVEKIRKAALGYRTSGTVNAGGDLRIWGDQPSHAAIRVDGRRPTVLPFSIRHSAAATSAVRAGTSNHLSPAVHRMMPEGIPLRATQPVTVFADKCLWADALTKVALLGPKALAERCLSGYKAKAVRLSLDGRVTDMMGLR